MITLDFRRSDTCLTNLLAFYNEMTGMVDLGRAVYGVYFDFSKAFTTFSHNVLFIEADQVGTR